jgi:hypothetical protein
MKDHADFCVCEGCDADVRAAVRAGLVDGSECEAEIQFGSDPVQDYFICSREPGHSGDHGYANVSMAHVLATSTTIAGTPFVVRWPRNRGKDRTYGGTLVLEAGEEGLSLPGQPASDSDFHDVAGANI